MNWTPGDIWQVGIMTVVNSLWFGTLLWLVFGLWLDVANFVVCLLGAVIVSWPVAIVRAGRAIERREDPDL